MLPILQVGPFAIPTTGLLLIIGLWIGSTLTEKHAPRFNLKPDQVYNLIFTMLISGIIGARLTVILQFPSAFIANPINILSANPSLLDISGGLLISLVAGYVYAQRKSMDIIRSLDALVPMLATLSIAISLSNLASGSAFGAPTKLPWAIELWGASRHPTQIYHLVIAIVIMWLVWPTRQNSKQPSGQLFVYFVSLTSFALLLIEGVRGDSVIISSGIRIAQIYILFSLFLSMAVYLRITHPKKR